MSGRRQWIAAGALLLACFGPALLGLASRTLEWNGYYDHLILAPLVSGWLAWTRWPGSQATASAWAWPPLVAGSWLNVVGRVEDVLFLQVAGMWLAVLGLVLATVGFRGAWSLRFPLVFLLLALPVPRATLDEATGALQLAVTGAAVEVLRAVGVPAVQSGTRVLLESAQVVVDRACSGLQGVLAFVALGALVAREAPGGVAQAVVMIAALPLAILANLVRVLALTTLAVHGPAWVGDAWLHAGLGLAVYALGLLALVQLRGLWGCRPTSSDPCPTPVTASTPPRSSLVALTVAAGLALVVPVIQREAESLPGPSLQVGLWSGEVLALPVPVEGGVYVRYHRPADPGFVDLYLIRAVGGRIEGHPPRGCFRGEGFEVAAGAPIRGLPTVAEIQTHTRGQERYLSAHWYRLGEEETLYPDSAERRLEAVLRRLVLRRPVSLAAIRLVTPLDGMATARLESFVREVVPLTWGGST